MLVTTHLIVGTVIGSLVASLPLSMLLAIISHYSLDLLPHWDQGVFKNNKRKFYFWAAVDFIVGGLALCLIFSLIDYQIGVLLAALAAILPDLIDSTPYLSNYLHRINILNKVYKFHEAIQKPGKKYQYSIGIIIQIVIIGISFVILIK